MSRNQPIQLTSRNKTNVINGSNGEKYNERKKPLLRNTTTVQQS